MFITKLDLEKSENNNPFWNGNRDEMDYSDEYPETFLSGNCYIFAYYLAKIYNYEAIHVNGDGCHCFCRAKVNDDYYYIDVRGIADDIKDMVVNSAKKITLENIVPIFDDELEYELNDKVVCDYAEYLIVNNPNIYCMSCQENSNM